MRRLIASIAVLMLAASCVLQSPLERSYAALGKEGDVIITIAMDKAAGTPFASMVPSDGILGSLADRASRLTLDFSPSDDGFEVSGIAEGNYSYAYVNSTLLHNAPGFDFVREGRIRYYSSDTIDAGVAAPGLLLFTPDYPSFYREVYSERVEKIPSDIADQMATAAVAIYSLAPKSLPSQLPLAVPENVVDKMDMILLLVNGYRIEGTIDMDSEESARTLVTILRNELIKTIRSQGGRPDFQSLAGVFASNGDKVLIDYDIPAN